MSMRLCSNAIQRIQVNSKIKINTAIHQMLGGDLGSIVGRE